MILGSGVWGVPNQSEERGNNAFGALPHESTEANRIKGTFRGLYHERDKMTISDGCVVT